MIEKATIIERIKAHHPRLRKDADIRVIGGRSAATVRANSPHRDLLVIANTARIDADREVVVPSGGQLGYFGENRSVFYDHAYSDADFIGKVRTGYPKLVGDAWHALIGIRRSPRGDQLVRDAEDFDVSVSIGFDALEVDKPTDEEVKRYGKGKPFDSIVRRWEWVELSVTWMPCNLDATVGHARDGAREECGPRSPYPRGSADSR
jgi:hypothetical protein